MPSRIDTTRPTSISGTSQNSESRMNFTRIDAWLKMRAPYYETQQTISAAGAISPDKVVTHITLTQSANVAFTLADATYDGQLKIIFLKTKSGAGDAVITPSNLAGNTTITLNTAKDCVVLEFVDDRWVVAGNSGATIA